MAVSFTRISYWIWGGKDQEVPAPGLNSSTDFPYREHDSLKFKSGVGARMRSSSRRKWQSREERRIDKEYDIVIVPSDGGCMSGSESDDSDWSIGWMEPHAADFLSDSESESGFAVLVPCYGRGRGDMREVPKNHVLGAAAVELHDGFSTDDQDRLGDGITTMPWRLCVKMKPCQQETIVPLGAHYTPDAPPLRLPDRSTSFVAEPHLHHLRPTATPASASPNPLHCIPAVNSMLTCLFRLHVDGSPTVDPRVSPVALGSSV